MTEDISELILNFKETLFNNYYNKQDEKIEFLEWLDSNINYENGVYSIHIKKIITEYEQEDTGQGNESLKSIVKSYARSKHDKQEYWDSLLDSGLSYSNGNFCFFND